MFAWQKIGHEVKKGGGKLGKIMPVSITEKELISLTCTDLLQINKKTSNLIEKCSEGASSSERRQYQQQLNVRG